jgi:hypothetical protein
VVVLAACGSTRTVTVRPVILNTERVERAIEASIFAQRRLHASASCPIGVVQQKGNRFTCFATVNGRRYPVAVTQADGAGHVTYVVR